jgi:biotin carboxyl carrier protein
VPDATPEPTLSPTVETAATPDGAAASDGVAARPADHAAIERLANGLLPALVAKLGATGLGEIEVREDGWKIRLRRPGGVRDWNGVGRRLTDRPSRSQPGHEGHGHARAAIEGHRSARHAATTHSTNGSSPPGDGSAHGSGHEAGGEQRHRSGDRHRVVATSPAVGVFKPHRETGPGTRVRSGDRLGAVDMLGVAQEVVAPADGIVTGVLVEAGDAVEYGQELVVLELMTQAGHG